MDFLKEFLAKTRLFGAYDFKKLKTKSDILAIAYAVKYANLPDVRAAGIDVLVELGDKSTGLLIEKLVSTKDDQLRAIASEVLAKIGDPAVMPLIELLAEKMTQELAVPVLGKIGEPAVEKLLQTLAEFHGNNSKRLGAVLALGIIGENSTNAVLRQLISNELAGQAVYFDNMSTSRPPTWPPSRTVGNTPALEKPCYLALMQVGDLSTLRSMALLTFSSTFHSGNPGLVFQVIAYNNGQKAIPSILEILNENPITDFGRSPLLEVYDNAIIIDVLEKIVTPLNDQLLRDKVIKTLVNILNKPKINHIFKKKIIACLGNLSGQTFATEVEWKNWLETNQGIPA